MMDNVEPKTNIQVQQAQGVFGGPQASSCEDANIVVIKAGPSKPIHLPWALFTFISYLLFLIVH
jgi:hypothetical protein